MATSHPKTLRIFPGSCSFPSETSPSSSALVRSPRRRPPVLSTWSTTERNKEMTVHGEDDSRDPAARAIILFFRDEEGYQLGCSGAVARLAHDQPSLFFSFLKMASQLFWFLQNNQRRPTCFSMPCWAGNLSRRGGMYFPQKMGYK